MPVWPWPRQPPVKCGPDHEILYKRAVTLLDNAEKKLNARYTAEAKSLAKEAKSLFAILQKECGPQQKERALTPKEDQQEAINQKLAADETAQAERLMKSAEEKFKKADQMEIPSRTCTGSTSGRPRRKTNRPKAQHQSGDLRHAHPADALSAGWPNDLPVRAVREIIRCASSIHRGQDRPPPGSSPIWWPARLREALLIDPGAGPLTSC